MNNYRVKWSFIWPKNHPLGCLSMLFVVIYVYQIIRGLYDFIFVHSPYLCLHIVSAVVISSSYLYRTQFYQYWRYSKCLNIFRACEALQQCLPDQLRDGTFTDSLQEDKSTKHWLSLLIKNVDTYSINSRQVGISPLAS